MPNQFKIYKSSAGSGKTFTLVKEYLCLVLRNPGDYKHILALTFTNKATQEMKSRIVDSLIQLSKNENESLKKILAAEIPEEKIQPHARLALDNILHDYSNFSVTTIDSFFNRIIRSLAREMQLPLRLEIKLDQDEVITDITSQLLLEISTDNDLLKWLTDFAIQKLSDDKGWNIEGEIHAIAKELFRENSIGDHLHSREEIKNFYAELKAIKARFENQMKVFGNEGMKAIAAHGLEVKDFAYGESGVAKYFDKIRMNISADAYLPGKRADDAAYDTAKWASKSSPKKKEIISIAQSTLQPLLQEILHFVGDEFPVYLGAAEVLKRIFLLGIVEDLSKKLKKYREENSLLLISDTPKILSDVISEDETPFVYEKSGTRFHHFLIDEFQDTSDLQWKNILPLVVNSLGGGNFGMVVGDIKQSIYRWRSGNMNLLDTEIEKHLHRFRSIIIKESLDTNYRSKKAIVDFNNAFFSAVPPLVNSSLELDGMNALDRAYNNEAEQKNAEKHNEGGRVEIHTIESEERGDETISWKDLAREKILEKINDACARGYNYGDIAVLVRTNTEGDAVATFLIERGITQVISPDSLLMMRSPEVRFLLNLLIFLDDRQNLISKSEILFYYASRNSSISENTHAVFSGISKKQSAGGKNKLTLFETEHLDNSLFSKTLPPAFTSRVRTLSKLPLYELCEQLVHIFGLKKTDAYVLRFLELVLEFVGKHDSSIRSFLNWWDESKIEEKTSVITSETGNAIRIMSIHKSKGLQFPVVIMPFTEWKLQPDARDVMWIESSDAPFSSFGKIPVSPNKAMKQSCFADSYQNEMIQAVTDNINLMYVAFTRAEEELYIFTATGEIKEMNSTGKLLRTVLQTVPEWSTKFDENNALLLGDLIDKTGNKDRTGETTANVFELKKYEVLNWHDKIRLSLRSEELIEILDSSVKRAINYGVLVHRVMSSIQQVSDADRVVAKFHSEGIITGEEKEKLRNEIGLLLEVKEIAAFFSAEYTVLNEHEILMPDGETLRPDRVLLKDGKAIVIDFKTGKAHSSHQNQINTYASALSKMNFTEIEKYLIYIAEKRILRVQ
ncbi:MAG: UvrD-helicase domain-containing protein [Bacteroidetes bacterium]|nr:UvrD-helicase domain-containing protein [Bacteroidota bacterium]